MISPLRGRTTCTCCCGTKSAPLRSTGSNRRGVSVAGPAAALDEVDRLDLASYHLFHATRADMLRRLGRDGEAADAYAEALARTANPVERAHLEDRRATLAAHDAPGSPAPPLL